MEILLPFVAWALVWIAGTALIAALPRSRGTFTASGEIAWLVGTGYFVGAFLLTVWMRLLSLAGIPLGRGSVGAPLVLLAAAGVWWIRRRVVGWVAPSSGCCSSGWHGAVGAHR